MIIKKISIFQIIAGSDIEFNLSSKAVGLQSASNSLNYIDKGEFQESVKYDPYLAPEMIFKVKKIK